MISADVLAKHLGCVEGVIRWGMYNEWHSFRVRGAQTGIDIWFHMITYENLDLLPDLYVGITPPGIFSMVKRNAILKFDNIRSSAELDGVDWDQLEVLCLEKLLTVGGD